MSDECGVCTSFHCGTERSQAERGFGEIDNREQAQEELILLGRRSKALLDDEDDELTPRKERRLPNIDF